MKVVVPIVVFVAIWLPGVISQQQALFIKRDAFENGKRVTRQTNADQMVQNILQWLQGVYTQNSRRIRQGSFREYLPPSNTQKPRPFEPPGQSGEDNFIGYPPSGSITPQPPFDIGTRPPQNGGYPGPSQEIIPPEQKPGYPGYPSSRPTTGYPGYPGGGFTTPSTPGYPEQTTGYPTGPTSGYPGQQTPGYPGSTGYPGGFTGYPSATGPTSTTKYPEETTGYPAASTPGYPGPSTPGYPGPSTGYPSPSTGYPTPSTPGYPGPSTGYPTPSTPGYPGPSTGYPTPPQNGYPGSTGYPTQPPSTGYPTAPPSTGYPTAPPDTGYPTPQPPSTGYPPYQPSTGPTERPTYPTQTIPTGPPPGYTTSKPSTFPPATRPTAQPPQTQYPTTQEPSYTTKTTQPDDNNVIPTEKPFRPGGDSTPGDSEIDEDLKHPPHIHAIDVECGKEMMTINIEFNRQFDGVIYSKGFYNNPECRYVKENSGQVKYSFTVSLNSCGTQFVNGFDTEGKSYLENVLVLQNEPGIQEVWDTIRSVRCLWEGNLNKALSVALSVGMLNEEIVTFSGDTAMARLDIQLGKGPFAQPANGLVKIGETMTLVVSVTGDPGFDIQVRDCRAKDSTGEHVVALTDENGCVLKPKLFGAFQKTRNTENTGASIIAYAFFNAFKFPDVMDLMLECNVELCKTDCEMCPDPNQKIEPGRRRRRDIYSYKNETIKDDSVTMGKMLRVILPEDLSDNQAIINLGQSEGVCMSTHGFVFSSALLISLLTCSCLFSAYLWLKNQNLSMKK